MGKVLRRKETGKLYNFIGIQKRNVGQGKIKQICVIEAVDGTFKCYIEKQHYDDVYCHKFDVVDNDKEGGLNDKENKN